MKRVLTIGRDYSSDIHINDNTDIVSRNHAIIEVGRFGKYYITDQSRNGTYVNGVRIPSQQKYEVCRGDEVSLAHTALLDWGLVPMDKTLLYTIVGIIAAVVAIAAVVIGVLYLDRKGSSSSSTNVEWTSGNGDASKPSSTDKITPATEDDKDGDNRNDKVESKNNKPSSNPSKSNSTSKEASEQKKVDKQVVDAIY